MVKIKDSTFNLDIKIMQKILHDREEYMSRSLFCEISETYEWKSDCFESPIEFALYAAIYAIDYSDRWGSGLYFSIKNYHRKIEDIKPELSISIDENKQIAELINNNPVLRLVLDPYDAGIMKNYLYNQVIIENYRVDFLLARFCWKTRSHKFLVIECDGHDFHERTKEQAKKDRERDRRLQELGFTVFRFTGSEIWADPMACANQIMDWV